MGFYPKGLFGCVFYLRGCLAKFLGCGNDALFWPYETSRLWDCFSIGKNGEFGLVCFIENVAAIVNLLLDFESPKLDLYSSSYGTFSGIATCYPVLTLYTV